MLCPSLLRSMAKFISETGLGVEAVSSLARANNGVVRQVFIG